MVGTCVILLCFSHALFQHLKDKFWNFLFYKFIFIFGVMNVQTLEEVVSWVAWFTILGFFTLLTQLAKDRFEYVSYGQMFFRLVKQVLVYYIKIVIFMSVFVSDQIPLLKV